MIILGNHKEKKVEYTAEEKAWLAKDRYINIFPGIGTIIALIVGNGWLALFLFCIQVVVNWSFGNTPPRFMGNDDGNGGW